MPSLSPDLLTGRHILVTGGGSGLGRAMAIRFAELGARVTVTGRRPEPLKETAQMVSSAGGEAAAIPSNVREKEEVDRLMAEAEERLGPLHGLVNNAAANFLARTEAVSANAFDAVVRTNLYGTFFCTQAVADRWIGRRSPGVVLSIVTTYAETGSAFVAASAASKAGVVALTKSLAVEWGRHGVRLNAIAPGPFPTKGAWERLVPNEAAEEMMRRRVPLNRFGRPEELATVAAFMMSDLAQYMNGAVLTLDGGEALSAGGQFNDLIRMDPEEVDQLLASMRR